MVNDLNVLLLRPVMEDWILRELNANLIVAVNHHRSKFFIKQIYQQIVKPQSFATSLIGCHVLSLGRTQSKGLLLPTKP